MKQYPIPISKWKKYKVIQNKRQLLVGGWQVMQTWELPLMKFLAREVTMNHGDVLEIGFGMGISANEIVKNGCKSYTVIEAHPTIANNARKWAESQKTKIIVLESFWQDLVNKINKKFDGILFDTFPLKRKEKKLLIYY